MLSCGPAIAYFCRDCAYCAHILIIIKICIPKHKPRVLGEIRVVGNLYPRWKLADPICGLGCDEGGNCVSLGAHIVPTWGPVIADSIADWCVEGMFLAWTRNLYPK